MIFLHNSITRKKEEFVPIDSKKITMYVCGPTVYDYAHIGNARSVVVYDVLFRLLKVKYPEVIYVRNITDVDDKIIKKALDSDSTPDAISEKYANAFHEDMKKLNCLEPTHEPKATKHIKEMIEMIENLIKNNHAYVSNKHVYFSVESYKKYGALSNRKIEEMISGSRIDISEEKNHPADFVLWKPSAADEIGWESPWGFGRPGWHIECSAMSSKYLGGTFDIHGGGVDLIFPHHENEIAQSCCASKDAKFARYWIHNGFLKIDGEKMSKSLGNIITVRDLLSKGISGDVIRFALLSAHYKKPLNWTQDIISYAKKSLKYFKNTLQDLKESNDEACECDKEFMRAIEDDLNTPLAITRMHALAKEINSADNCTQILLQKLGSCLNVLGILSNDKKDIDISINDDTIKELILKRMQAKKDKNFSLADQIRDDLSLRGIELLDKPDHITEWKYIK